MANSKTLYHHITEACDYVSKTQQTGDREKWAAYQALDSKGKMTLSNLWGHREFCRLQRLSFHKFV